MTNETITASNEGHIDKAVIALERAHGIIDSLYALEVVGGIESLYKTSLGAMLDVAMGLISEAKDEIIKEADAAKVHGQAA